MSKKETTPDFCNYEALARAHVRAILGYGLPTAINGLVPEVLAVVVELCVGFYGDGVEAGLTLAPYNEDGVHLPPHELMGLCTESYLLGYNDGRRKIK